jgi:hypothetical protein
MSAYTGMASVHGRRQQRQPVQRAHQQQGELQVVAVEAQDQEHRQRQRQQPPLGVGDGRGELVLPRERLGVHPCGGQPEGGDGAGRHHQHRQREHQRARAGAQGAEDPRHHAAQQQVLGEHGPQGVATGHARLLQG